MRHLKHFLGFLLFVAFVTALYASACHAGEPIITAVDASAVVKPADSLV
jgi:hypothetical protein